MEQGIAQVQKKNYDAAIRLFGLAIAENPRLAAAFYHRANVWSLKDDADRAISDYTEAVRADRTFQAAFFKRGWVRLNQKGDPDAALEDFSLALKIDPRYADALLWRGQAYRQIKAMAAALADMEEAINCRPSGWAYSDQADRWLAETRLQVVAPVKK